MTEVRTQYTACEVQYFVLKTVHKFILFMALKTNFSYTNSWFTLYEMERLKIVIV